MKRFYEDFIDDVDSGGAFYRKNKKALLYLDVQ